jgi:hypothetical protein
VTDGSLVFPARCAWCCAGQCVHDACGLLRKPGVETGNRHAMQAVTYVAGTAVCGDCAWPMLDFVRYPLRTAGVQTSEAQLAGGQRITYGLGGALYFCDTHGHRGSEPCPEPHPVSGVPGGQ